MLVAEIHGFKCFKMMLYKQIRPLQSIKLMTSCPMLAYLACRLSNITGSTATPQMNDRAPYYLYYAATVMQQIICISKHEIRSQFKQ